MSERNTEGMCMACKEWTDAKDSCCGAPVYVEGGFVDPDDFLEEDAE